MDYFIISLWVVFYLCFPALVVYLCRKIKFLGKIGAILLLYFIGVIVGNLVIFRVNNLSEMLFPLQDALTSATIPLAMPLILFSCNFKKWSVKKSLASLLIGVFSVVTVAIIGYFLFKNESGYKDFNKISGMIIGVYTGGTPNLAALKMMLNVDEATFLLMNSFDMIVSFFYLAMLMAVGIKFFRWVLPVDKSVNEKSEYLTDNEPFSAEEQTIIPEDESYRYIFSKNNRKWSVIAIILSIIIAGIGIAVSFAATGRVDMTILILTLTTLAIACSFIPTVRKMVKSYDIGMYLVLVFSLVVASMVDIKSINFHEGLYLFLYIVFAILGSLVLQTILGKIFKIDADTTVITSVALINSPLFVPMIADSMKNKKIIITGVTIGIIGYAIGNYLGVLISGLLG